MCWEENAKGPRVIDLDLLLYGDRVNNSELLVLPHPRLHLRQFVLQPLAELAPDLIHPKLKQTIGKLLETSNDQSAVHRWPKK
jgi:2-amino-4-hydroxy-6-hydroxymethyldihydropteridine diphosphokinase